MRAAFGLFTALPLDVDGEQPGAGWMATAVVGLVLGVAWLITHQLAGRVGGPFVGGGAVLLLHVVVTGARSLRGVAAISRAVIVDPAAAAEEGDEEEADDAAGWADPRDGDPDAALARLQPRGPRGPLALPDVEGAGTAVITLLLLIATALLIRVDVAPAVLVVVPIAGKGVQALLLGDEDVDVGVIAPTAQQKAVVLGTSLLALLAAPAMAAVTPRRFTPPLEGLGYVGLGIGAIAAALAAGLLARAWLRARFGGLDANGWHALGAVTELAALAVVVGAVS